MDGQCTADYVELFDGIQRQRFCGYTLGNHGNLRYRSVNSWVLVKFVSDEQGTDTGFKVNIDLF